MDIKINPPDIDNVNRKLSSLSTETLQVIVKFTTKLKKEELLEKREIIEYNNSRMCHIIGDFTGKRNRRQNNKTIDSLGLGIEKYSGKRMKRPKNVM